MIFLSWFVGGALGTGWMLTRTLVDVWLGIGFTIYVCFGFLQIPLYCIDSILTIISIIPTICGSLVLIITSFIFEWIPLVSIMPRIGGVLSDIVGAGAWTLAGCMCIFPSGFKNAVFTIFYGLWAFIELFFVIPAAIFHLPVTNVSLASLTGYLLGSPVFIAFIYRLCSLLPCIVHILMLPRFIAAYTSYATQIYTVAPFAIVSVLLDYANICITPGIWLIDISKSIIFVCAYLCSIPIEVCEVTFFTCAFF